MSEELEIVHTYAAPRGRSLTEAEADALCGTMPIAQATSNADFVPFARMPMNQQVEWRAEAKRAGLGEAEITSRIIRHYAGVDSSNRLLIKIDHAGKNDQPIPTPYLLAAGAKLLLDPITNPEIEHAEHVAQLYREAAFQQEEDRRHRHEETEAQRKREIESELKQRFSRTPVARAFAIAFDNRVQSAAALVAKLETTAGKDRAAVETQLAKVVAQRDLLELLLPLTWAHEATGPSVGYMPSKTVADLFGFDFFTPRKYGGG